ncbi:MAG: hypothetical protein JW863_13445 [Chitinispirillaceae bacterium]|nr:hypothetical protein [Chitinispirillaceae bacterium]
MDTQLILIPFSTAPHTVYTGGGRSAPPPAKGGLATTLGTRAFFQRRSELQTPRRTGRSIVFGVLLLEGSFSVKQPLACSAIAARRQTPFLVSRPFHQIIWNETGIWIP